ncbi:Ig-like domain-containing protein [Mycobacterium deserti]|uniref:Ig-like domain-containing protein n=1 Tax=Mycobacterium deserti TaxID=2978347 RepID=A0ABT2MFS9_9MYCO|nr:Ig-like domain-containing protein [Mycobacterium deserti]MCT7660821.1 Ig-like domain-containing protein [Mycobacterium deserti]
MAAQFNRPFAGNNRASRRARNGQESSVGSATVAVGPEGSARHRVRPAVNAGCGRYVGRVGALAIALGVGVAVATGSGMGVARAQDGADASNTSQGPANDGANPGAEQETGAVDPGQVQTEQPVGSGDPAEQNDPGNGVVPEMNVSVSGGATVTGAETRVENGDENLSPTGETPTTPAPETAAPPAPVEPPPTFVPPPTETVVPPEVPSVDPSTPQAPTGRSAQSKDAGTADSANVNAPAGSGVSLAAEDGHVSLFSLTADSDEELQLVMAAAAPGTPAPAPLVPQPSNPVEAVLGGVQAVTNIVTTALSMFLSGFLAPGPTTPAPPVMLFVVLGWAQRELQRTFLNQSPTAVADTVTTAEDDDVTIPVLANDTDGDLGAGDVLTVTDFTQPANGEVVLNPNGTFTYTPDANFNGTDTFSYTVSDEASPWHLHGLAGFFGGGGHSSTTTVTVNVTPVEDNSGAPVADNDTATVNEGQSIAISVLDGDTDPDGNTTIDPTTVQVLTQPTNGAIQINPATGAITYTHNGSETTTDLFTYTVQDTSGAPSNTATVTITITPVNDGAPVADNDTATVNEGQSIAVNVLDGDTDPNGNTTIDPTTVQVLTQPTNGAIQINPATGAITYTHNGSETTTDLFTYTVQDTSGAPSNTATVTITITPVNDAPTLGSPAFVVDSVNQASGVVVGHVDVVDSDSGILTYSVSPISPAIGTVTVNSTTGVWTFTPTTQTRLTALTSPGDETVGFTINVTDGQLSVSVPVVAPIDPPAAAVTGSIAAGPLPQGVAVVGDRLYVVNQNPSTVTVIDLDTNTVIDLNPATPAIDRIAVGSAPFATAVQGTRLYVANINGDSVTIIDTTTNTVIDANPATPAIDTIPVGNGPHGMAISGDRLYVTNRFGNTVTVIDTTTNTVVDANPATPAIDPIAVGNSPNGAAVSGNHLYVANLAGNTVSVIDTATNTVIHNISVPNPYAVAANGNRLYVTNANNDTVTVIDTTTDTIIDANPATPAIDAIPVGDGPGAIAISGNRLYVANTTSNTVTVIDATTNTVLATLNVGSSPMAVAVSGNHVYTANQSSGTVTVITTDQ